MGSGNGVQCSESLLVWVQSSQGCRGSVPTCIWASLLEICVCSENLSPVGPRDPPGGRKELRVFSMWWDTFTYLRSPSDRCFVANCIVMAFLAHSVSDSDSSPHKWTACAGFAFPDFLGTPLGPLSRQPALTLPGQRSRPYLAIEKSAGW